VKLLTISGDSGTARGLKGPHYYMLEEFHSYWERLDILVPFHPEAKDQVLFDNVHIHVSPYGKWFRSKWLLKKGLELLKEEKHDLIAAHDYPPFINGKAARKLSEKTKIPFILELYHVEGYPVAINLKEKIRHFMTALYIKSVWRHPIAIRVINKSQVPGWLNFQGVDESKALLLYSSYTDLEVFKPEIREKEVDVLYVGRLVGNKGLFDLIEASKKIKELKVRIVGTGPLEKTLRRLIKIYQLEDRVELAGWAEDNKEIARHINSAKSLVCCSRSEGGPRTTIEAMACEVPVLTTPVGTMPDIIQHRVNGLILEFNAASLESELLWLLENPEKADQIAKKGRQSVLSFERKKLIKEYALGYQNLLTQQE